MPPSSIVARRARTWCAALAAGLAAGLVVPVAASGAPAIADPRAPQNPHLAANPGSNIHNDTWMTDAYARRGPSGPASSLRTALGALPPSICSAMTFDRRGRLITVCPSLVAPPVLRILEPRTLRVIDEHVLPDAPSPAGTVGFQNFAGGGYFFLDDRDRVWVATKTNHLHVMEHRATGWVRVRDYDLTSAVVGDERISSALPDFRGRIWFVTKRSGKVGVLDPRTREIRVRRTGEAIQNSFTVDRDGVYVVSSKRMYRFGLGADGRPRVRWSVRYANSGIRKPGQADAGSGTTPTILPGGLVAITDNADRMNVVVYRTRVRLPRGQRRTVCEVPVFARGAGATENSLIGSGRSLIVENNHGYRDPFGAEAGTRTTGGMTRIDLDRDRERCRTVWENDDVRAPSVVPKLSTGSQLVYTYEQDVDAAGTQTWSWTGLDARTGKRRFTVPAGTGLSANNNYAGITIGPDGTAYLGTVGGIRALRRG